jgi:hypothetical protein
MGANMSVPYGAWMGSAIHDSFYAPHELCVEIQQFLAEHERLFSRRTYAETAVVYSVESNFQRIAERDLFADNRDNSSQAVVVPFWQACEALSDAAQPYDVICFPEGELRPDTLAPEDLRQYRTVVLPDCHTLTAAQAQMLLAYLDAGGQVVVVGDAGTNLDEGTRGALLGHERAVLLRPGVAFDASRLPGAPQVRVAGGAVALNVQRVETGAAVHLVRYDYDESADRVPALPELTVEVRLPERFASAIAYGPNGVPEVALAVAGDTHRLVLRDVPLYSVVVLSR